MNQPTFQKTGAVITRRNKRTGAIVSRHQSMAFVHPCCVCGTNAPFGFGVNLRQAIEDKDVARAGKWYCAEHRHLGEETSGRFV